MSPLRHPKPNLNPRRSLRLVADRQICLLHQQTVTHGPAELPTMDSCLQLWVPISRHLLSILPRPFLVSDLVTKPCPTDMARPSMTPNTRDGTAILAKMMFLTLSLEQDRLWSSRTQQPLPRRRQHQPTETRLSRPSKMTRTQFQQANLSIQLLGPTTCAPQAILRTACLTTLLTALLAVPCTRQLRQSPPGPSLDSSLLLRE